MSERISPEPIESSTVCYATLEQWAREQIQTQLQRLQQMGRALVDDIERRKAEERRKYFAEVTVIVNRIAEAQKLDLVLQEAVFAGRAVDLTDQVIKQLGGPAPGSHSAAGAPAGAPAANVKPPAKPPAK